MILPMTFASATPFCWKIFSTCGTTSAEQETSRSDPGRKSSLGIKSLWAWNDRQVGFGFVRSQRWISPLRVPTTSQGLRGWKARERTPVCFSYSAGQASRQASFRVARL